MRQVVAEAPGVEAIAIGDDGVKHTCGIARHLDKAVSTENPMSSLPRRRAASLLITVTLLAATSVSETQAEYVEPRAWVHLAQARSSDPGTSQRALEQHRAEVLARALAAALATVRRDREPQTSLAAKPGDEIGEPKQGAKSGTAESRKSLQQERERADQLEQALAVARRDIETAKAATAAEEVARDRQVAESTSAELRKSLQQERERAGRLEQELASARRDVGTQTARAAKASEEAATEKQAAASTAAELRNALLQEHDKAETLAQEVSAARTRLSEYEGQTRKTSDEAADLKQAAEGIAELQKSLGQERQRTAQLERDLTDARANVAQAAKAGEETVREKQLAEGAAAALRKSLQQAQDRAEALAQEVTAVRAGLSTQEAEAAKARDEVADLKQAADGAAELKKLLNEERERAGMLEQALVVARRDVDAQTALAAKASEEAARDNQVAGSETEKLRKSLKQEQGRAEALAQELSAARAGLFAQEAEARQARDAAADLKRAAQGTEELTKSLQQERERAGLLEQALSAAQRDVETQTALAEEIARDRQVAESTSAELRKSLQQERDRAEALTLDISKARAGLFAYETQARKAGEEAADLKQVAEGTAELRQSLSQERERAGRLEQDLAAARRDVEKQTTQAAKASEEAARLNQLAERAAEELRKSLQQEREKAEALSKKISAARSRISAEAQARNASEQAAADLKQAAEGAAELQKSLQRERERAGRLEQALAVANRDLETQTALAAKAREEAARDKQVAESGSAALEKSLRRERERSLRLERELALALGTIDVSAAPEGVTGQVTLGRQREADAAGPVATVGEARGGAQGSPQDAAEVARLMARASVLLRQGDIGSARIVLERAAETGSAQASFALAETYDPLVLPKWGTYGTRGDALKAQALYAKAVAGGIKEGKERAEALRRAVR